MPTHLSLKKIFTFVRLYLKILAWETDNFEFLVLCERKEIEEWEIRGKWAPLILVCGLGASGAT